MHSTETLNVAMKRLEKNLSKAEYLHGKPFRFMRENDKLRKEFFVNPKVYMIFFDESNATIQFVDSWGNRFYEIDMETAKTDMEIADWIFHMTEKRWCSPSVLHALVRLIQNITAEVQHQVQDDFFSIDKHGFDWTRWLKRKHARENSNKIKGGTAK